MKLIHFLSGNVLNNRKIIFLAAQKCLLALHVRNTNLCLNYGSPLFTSAIQSASIERRLSQKVNGWQGIITRLKSSPVSPLNNHVYFGGHACSSTWVKASKFAAF